MSRQEIMNTRFGEMQDLISCLSVYRGVADLKAKKTGMSVEDAMAME